MQNNVSDKNDLQFYRQCPVIAQASDFPRTFPNMSKRSFSLTLISVRDNELFSFTRQKKIDHATNITGEIAAYAYQIFKENYNWSKPIRSVGVRGADLVTDNYWEQIDLFSSVEKREKQMKMDNAVDEIRRRFGFYSIQRGLMYRDRILSAVNAKEEHTVHPHGYFSG